MPQLFGEPATDITIQTCHADCPAYRDDPTKTAAPHVHAPTFLLLAIAADGQTCTIRVPKSHLNGTTAWADDHPKRYPWFHDPNDRGPIATINPA